jgi:peptidoglycan/xylan/chitin deacetylase (PgdA/CDA1 family)
VIETLAHLQVTATFFLVGEHIAPNRALVSEMHTAGHELAVHGWTHACTLALAPERLQHDMEATAQLIADITGRMPRWYRPPYGVHTVASAAAARQAGLAPVQWTAWGRDWSRWVTSQGIANRVNRTLRPGGTVLLHDTDRYASPGAARRTNEALRQLIPGWRQSGWAVGPLREHWDIGANATEHPRA